MRTKVELMNSLVDQMRMIKSSIGGYCRGELFEVPRIATSISNIVSDAYGPSILSQLKEKDHTYFLISALIERDGNMVEDHPLIGLSMNPLGRGFEPISLANMMNGTAIDFRCAVKFEEWWEKQPIFKTPGYYFKDKEPKSKILTRKRLIRSFRNQDGGAHYAPDLLDPVYKMVKSSDVGWSVSTANDDFDPITGALDAMVVQVAIELMSTLLSKFTDIPTSL